MRVSLNFSACIMLFFCVVVFSGCPNENAGSNGSTNGSDGGTNSGSDDGEQPAGNRKPGSNGTGNETPDAANAPANKPIEGS